MATRPERRHNARLTIPPQFNKRALAPQLVQLLDLSLKGARIEHPDALNAGLLCFIDLPPALGRGTLSGRVVWTKLHRREQTLEGERRHFFQSGLIWTGLTPTQQDALTTALDLLTATPQGPPPDPPTGTPRERPAEPGKITKNRA